MPAALDPVRGMHESARSQGPIGLQQLMNELLRKDRRPILPGQDVISRNRSFPAGCGATAMTPVVGHASTWTAELVYRQELQPVITTGAEIMNEVKRRSRRSEQHDDQRRDGEEYQHDRADGDDPRQSLVGQQGAPTPFPIL